jgi:DNA-binding CsgD family transcriptional regulator
VLLRLLDVGTRIQALDPDLGRTVIAEAVNEAIFLEPDVVAAAVAALDSAETPGPPTASELVLRGYTRLYTDGFPAGTDDLRRAVSALREVPELTESDLATLGIAQGVALSMWDLDNMAVLGDRSLELARRVGAMSRLPRFLGHCAGVEIAKGDHRAAEALFAEGEAVGEAMGTPGTDRMQLDAFAFACDEALKRIDQSQLRALSPLFEYDAYRATALLGAGHYERALEAAQRACDNHPAGVVGFVLVDLVEAAARSGHLSRARAAMVPLVERTQLSGTDWALGLEARCRALVSEDDTAEGFFNEAVDRLAQTAAVPDLARGQLLYGEWLRRAGRRTDAREQLRAAHDAFVDIGMPGFAERARRELVATGETPRKRVNATHPELTAQEMQVVRMALDGQTNSEIGGQLFLSPRTVEWHLTRVYGKLGITSRRELRGVVPAAAGPTRA